MSTPPDEFAQNFDAIDIARVRTPLPAVDRALNAEPGFYLADDAGGRFVIDREFGVVSLRDEGLLATEYGQVHGVQLHVVETTGESYVLDLQLRVTGLVPQMVGAEDFGFGDPQGFEPTPTPSTRVVPWTQFSPVRGRQAAPRLSNDGAYGALLSPELPPCSGRVIIAFGETVPQPAPAHARWTI